MEPEHIGDIIKNSPLMSKFLDRDKIINSPGKVLTGIALNFANENSFLRQYVDMGLDCDDAFALIKNSFMRCDEFSDMLYNEMLSKVSKDKQADLMITYMRNCYEARGFLDNYITSS